MEKPLVAITIRSFNQTGLAMEKLKSDFTIIYRNDTGSRLSEDNLISAIQQAEYVIAGTEAFTKRVIEVSPNLKVISRVGVGLDSIDIITAKKHNIQIFNTPKATVQSVAEHTLGLLLSTIKRIPQYNNQIRIGNYSVNPGILLSGKKIGIVGLGRIGFQVASILAMLGCKIRYYDPYLQVHPPKEWILSDSLEDLVSKSDILSIHSIPKSDGSTLINQKVIAKCRKGIVIINTARGSLIDEAALEDGLNMGTVSAAALDVFSHEPYSGPLLKYSQVIVTPHVASNTIESREQMELESVENTIAAKKRRMTT